MDIRLLQKKKFERKTVFLGDYFDYWNKWEHRAFTLQSLALILKQNEGGERELSDSVGKLQQRQVVLKCDGQKHFNFPQVKNEVEEMQHAETMRHTYGTNELQCLRLFTQH